MHGNSIARPNLRAFEPLCELILPKIDFRGEVSIAIDTGKENSYTSNCEYYYAQSHIPAGYHFFLFASAFVGL